MPRKRNLKADSLKVQEAESYGNTPLRWCADPGWRKNEQKEPGDSPYHRQHPSLSSDESGAFVGRFAVLAGGRVWRSRSGELGYGASVAVMLTVMCQPIRSLLVRAVDDAEVSARTPLTCRLQFHPKDPDAATSKVKERRAMTAPARVGDGPAPTAPRAGLCPAIVANAVGG